ncbi:MAG: glycosyltransferase [Bacteroidales bacterium]|nr:glycosyltransferase [Bacteroidales bacterium]
MDKNHSPFLSIIVPVYNKEKYLHECIDSILGQEFTDFELILVDDGSTDKSDNICDIYSQQDDRITVIHQTNQGSANARNTGLRRASGKYISLVDADDLWINNIPFDRYLTLLNQNPELDFIIFRMIDWYTKRSKKTISTNFPQNSSIVETPVKEKLNELLSNGIFPMSQCDKIVRRDFLLEHSLFFREGHNHEDMLWFLDICSLARNFICLNEEFYVYRKGVPDSITANEYEIRSIADFVFFAADRYKEQEGWYPEFALGFLTFRYLQLLSNTDRLTATQRSSLKKYRWLLKYDKDKRVKLIKTAAHYFSYPVVLLMFKIYSRFIRPLIKG